MDPGLLRDTLTVGLGLLTGIMSGLFGVGGAVISTPGIRALGATPLLAVGTTLPSIIPGAASGTARYAREGLVDWRVVAVTAPTGIVAAVLGALAADHVPGEGHLLMLMTAALLGYSALRMARSGPAAADASDLAESDAETAPTDRPEAEGAASEGRASHDDAMRRQPKSEQAGHDDAMRRQPKSEQASHDDAMRRQPKSEQATRQPKGSGWAFAGVGTVAGGLSGLLGIGGGIVMVPGFTQVGDLPVKTAIGTSLACVGLFAVPGTVTHALLGHIDWRFALLLAVGVIPGARIGAALAIRSGDQRLRRVVAIFLGLMAVAYGLGETLALID